MTEDLLRLADLDCLDSRGDNERSSDDEERRAYVASSRLAQGLPVTVADATALATIARLLGATSETVQVGGELRSLGDSGRARAHIVKKSA